MTKSKLGHIVTVAVISAFLAGCGPTGNGVLNGQDDSGDSICTQHASLIRQYEGLVGYAGFFPRTHLDIWGTYDVMQAVGEPEPDEIQGLLKKRVEFVAYSSFAQQCFSSDLRQAMLEYVNG